SDHAFHTIRDVNDGGSITILNGDLVETLSLISSGAPSRFGDRIGAVVNVETRHGNAQHIRGRADLEATSMSYTLEGPLSRKLTAIGSFRKSYAAWLVRKLSGESNIVGDLGLTDGQGNVSFE